MIVFIIFFCCHAINRYDFNPLISLTPDPAQLIIAAAEGGVQNSYSGAVEVA